MEKEIKEYGNGEIICPYCKYEHTDSWECGLRYDGDHRESECDGCGKKFYVSLSIDTTYNTLGLCKENNVEHNWEYFDHTTDEKRTYGRKCLTCGEYEFDVEEDDKDEN